MLILNYWKQLFTNKNVVPSVILKNRFKNMGHPSFNRLTSLLKQLIYLMIERIITSVHHSSINPARLNKVTGYNNCSETPELSFFRAQPQNDCRIFQPLPPVSDRKALTAILAYDNLSRNRKVLASFISLLDCVSCSTTTAFSCSLQENLENLTSENRHENFLYSSVQGTIKLTLHFLVPPGNWCIIQTELILLLKDFLW